MKILGISGIARSVPFKRAHWPGLEERLYRISQGHDSAAALVVDGQIVAAAAEERFNRRKHCGDFPIGAIRYCLAEGGLSAGDLDAIVHGFDYSRYELIFRSTELGAREYREVYSKDALLELVGENLAGFPRDRVHQVAHHLAHAASTYYTSGWDECLVAIVDAMGEALGASIYHAKDGKLQRVGQISSHDSIGVLYSLVTLHLGFDFNADEYKIMGLAPYGDPSRYRNFFERAVELRPDGGIRIPLLRLNESREDQENYVVSRRHLDANLIAERGPEDEISQDHRDVAAALQACLDRAMLHICGHWGRKHGLRRLAMAGGVALNCTANGKLLGSGLFDEIYVQPASGDDGIALGAALQHAAQAGELENRRCRFPSSGPRSETRHRRSPGGVRAQRGRGDAEASTRPAPRPLG